VTEEHDALLKVTGVLEGLGIPHMVAGSVASSVHGRPRSTHDVDVVFDPTPAQLDALVQSLAEAGFHVDLERARDALRRRLQFNAIETRTAFKVDLIVRKDRAFSREELNRRQAVELGPGVSVTLATPEDTILSKLEWSMKAGRSEKQLEDAAGVLAINRGLDVAYIERWASELGVLELWQEIRSGTPGPG
jgi:hypothetical protein